MHNIMLFYYVVWTVFKDVPSTYISVMFGASHSCGGACESDVSKSSSGTVAGTCFVTLSNHCLCWVSKCQDGIERACSTHTVPIATSAIQASGCGFGNTGMKIEA